jgi:hypothetical protein
MPAVPLTEDMVVSNHHLVKYPNPFFDLANTYIPRNIKTLFAFCRNFFHTNGFLRNVITKLTEYPITDILYDSTISPETKEKWDVILDDKLKIKSFLIEAGLDYFTYGNCFISTMMKSKRFLTCTNCGNTDVIENVKFKLRNFEFYGECQKCKQSAVKMKIKDEVIKSIDNFRLIRWAPENIDIDYNPITGHATYYYAIPTKIKALITAGNVNILRDIPEIFLVSMKTSKRIELDPDNLFHMKFPTLAEEDMGWGKPLILPALKDIYYLQTLRRGNEAIANEHIVPKKTISPANTTTMDPYSQMNLGQWRSEVEDTIKKWKRDPNHIAIFPIPMTYQELGGNAKSLMLTPEMRFIEENIINSLGVPLEFIKGGASWTGSSVSLRIVENHFLTYRELLTDLLNYFIVPKLVSYLNYPKVKLLFKKFKMADDSETKQLAINLNAAGKISDARLVDEFGYDYAEEQEALKKSRVESLDASIDELEKQAEAQGKAAVIQAKYQVRAQTAAEQEQMKVKTEMFLDELAVENEAIPEDPTKLIEKYALQLLNMDPGTQNMVLQDMAQTKPITYSFVIQRLLQYQGNQAGMTGGIGEIPNGNTQAPNTKGVGKREGDKIKITNGDKQHGPTRGSV